MKDRRELQQNYAGLFTGFPGLFGPAGGLHFADVCFFQKVKAQPRLPDAASHCQGKRVLQHHAVEGKQARDMQSDRAS